MKRFKEYLTEFPNITVPIVFDLELETKPTLNDLKSFLKRLFSGKLSKDKHGNTLLLKTDKEKSSLKSSILRDKDILLNLKHKYKEDITKFKEFLKTL